MSLCEGSDEITIRKVPSSEIVQRFKTSHLQIFMFDVKSSDNDGDDRSKLMFSCASFTSMVKVFNGRTLSDDTFEVSKEFMELKGHSSNILCVSFHPTEKQIATVSRDGTVKIFTTMTMKERIEIHRTSKAKINVDETVLLDQNVTKLTKHIESLKGQDHFSWIRYVSNDLLAALSETRESLILMRPDLKAKKLTDVRMIEHLTPPKESVTSITTWQNEYIVTGDTEGLVKIWRVVEQQ